MPPTRWDDWVHVTIATLGSWLPGDPRGFRDHDHRVHSTGHYKATGLPPEHTGLHRYARSISAHELVLPSELRPTIAKTIAEKLLECTTPPRIIAVAGQHGHLLFRVGQPDAKPIVGRAKQAASFAVRARLPGNIWAQGCHVVRVRDRDHYRVVVDYIQRHADDGAALWVHPDLRKASGPASHPTPQPDLTSATPQP